MSKFLQSMVDAPLVVAVRFPCTIALMCFYLTQLWKGLKDVKKRLPPGPWRLPFIGNLHQLVNDLPHRALRSLSQRYGPIMHLQLGEISAIVVSSPDMAKEIMKTQDLHFATRPKVMTGNISFYNYTDIALCPYGDYRRNMRNVCIVELLSAKMVKSFNSIRQEEISNLISSLQSNTHNSLINLTNKIFWFTSSVTCRSASGKLVPDQEKFIKVVKEVISLSGGFDLADLFPSQKWLHKISGMKSKLLKAHTKADVILEDIINEHRENRANGKNGNGESGGENLVDVLLRIMESGEFGMPITNQDIKALIFGMFMAGSETSSTTIIWALAELIKNPSVMAKAQLEVRQVLKGKKAFEDTDLEELKYVELVIKETLRLHAPVPLLLPRECREETKIDGYIIPERFENNSIDFKGNHFEFIPFGAGRRICAGMLFGLANVGHP